MTLEDRNSPSELTLGPKGINSLAFGKTGANIAIGQAEPSRPGLRPFDTNANSHPDVTPAAVFRRDGNPVADKDIEDHAIQVAGIMISKKAKEGVAPAAKLYSTAFSPDTVERRYNNGREQGKYLRELDTVAIQKLALPKEDGPVTRPVRAINLSFKTGPGGYAVDPLPLNGTFVLSAGVDYIATKSDTLFVIAKGNLSRPTGFPADSYNGLIVGGLTGANLDKVARSTDTTTLGADRRRLTDVLAPGEKIDSATRTADGNGTYTPQAGSSVAAPFVTGTVALLQEWATDNKQPLQLGEEVHHHEVMKAAILNSAEKVKDRLGMDKTVTRTDGKTWDDSDAADKPGNEVIGSARTRDIELGVGALDATRARQQLEHRGRRTDAERPGIGWDYDTITRPENGPSNENVYKLPKLKGGSWVSATIAWDRIVQLDDKPGGTEKQFDAGIGETFTVDRREPAGLTLYLLKKGEDTPMWTSTNNADTIQHIFFQVDKEDSEYELAVTRFERGSSNYAIAWWTDPVDLPEPAEPKKEKGTVWNDLNHDGVRNSSEPRLQNVRVDLYSAVDNSLLDTRYTDWQGEYEFTTDETQSYYVRVTAPQGNTLSPQNVGSDTLDSDVNSSGVSHTFTGTSSAQDWTIDAGLYLTPGIASIGDRIWEDRNADGVQDSGEPGLTGVDVTLRDMDDNLVQGTTTGADGFYTFFGVAPGRYKVEFASPSGYLFSTSPEYYTWAYAGDIITDVDAGLYQPVSISDRVWVDANENGIQDGPEAGLADVQVELLSAEGELIDSTVTDSYGHYSFTGLVPSGYAVGFTPSQTNYALTQKDQGSDDALDSDADPTTGHTDPFTLTSGQTTDTWDAGFRMTSTLGDRVWNDYNHNGIQDVFESGVAGATVRLLNGSGGVISTTTTDAFGSYSFAGLTAGTYEVQFVTPSGYWFTTPNATSDEYDSDANTSTGRTGTFTLAANENRTNIDAGMYGSGGSGGSGGSIGDRVWDDADQDGVQTLGESGIAGATVHLLNGSGSVLATTTTNGSGYYGFFGLAAGTYEVEFVAPYGYAFTTPNATTDIQDSDADIYTSIGRTGIFTLATNQNRTDIDAGLFASGGSGGSIGDWVWFDADHDGIQNFAMEPGLGGATVRLLNESGSVVATTTTDGSGHYLFSGLAAGTYEVEFVAPSGYSFSPPYTAWTDTQDSDADMYTGRTGTFPLATDQNRTDIDAGLYSGFIGDRVWTDTNHNGVQDSGELGLGGATVKLLDGSGSVLTTTTTNSSGNYSFIGLGAGTYEVEFVAPSGYTLTTPNATGDTQDSDANTSTGRTGTFTLATNQTRTDIDAGVFVTGGFIGDRVWTDYNHNGVQDSGELGLGGVTVKLLNASGSVVTTVATNVDGNYGFSGLAAGTYEVQFVAPYGYSFSPANATGDSIDSDANTSTGRTGTFTLGTNEGRTDIDAGVYTGSSGGSGGWVGDRVWFDADHDGAQDVGELGLAGVTVRLLNGSGSVLATTTTDGSGNYGFSGLAAGTYEVEFVTPSGYSFSPANATGDSVDSDANTSTGRTGTFTLIANQTTIDVDAGMYTSGGSGGSGGSIGDRVWFDTDHDGVQDAGESGLAGVTVRLLNGSGAVLATTSTDANGNYSFAGLGAGTYEVQFITPSGYTFSPANATGDNQDSDADTSTGRTGTFTLAANQVITNIDAGMFSSGGSGGSGGILEWPSPP